MDEKKLVYVLDLRSYKGENLGFYDCEYNLEKAVNMAKKLIAVNQHGFECRIYRSDGYYIRNVRFMIYDVLYKRGIKI